MNHRPILFALALVSASFARISLAVFPLANESGDELLDWVGSAPAAVFFDQLYASSAAHMWDPVFLAQVDTSAWSMQSDSILLFHGERWEWDVALGGSFTGTRDSVVLHVQAVRRGAGGLERSEWTVGGEAHNAPAMCGTLIGTVLEAAGVEPAPEERARLTSVPVRNPEAYATYVAGFRFEMLNQPNKALSAYSFARAADGGLALATCRMAMIYSQVGNVEMARALFSEAAGKATHSPYIVAQSSLFAVGHGQFGDAAGVIDANRSVLELSAEGMRAIGTAYMLSGEHQRAIAALNRALSLGPVDLETDIAMGKAYLASGRHSLAIDVFNRLVEFRPVYVRYYSLLGVAYRTAGEIMQSATILEGGRRLDPDNVPNLVNLANTYTALGMYRDAEQLLIRSLDMAPDMSFIYLNLGVVYWHMNKPERAREMFEKAAGLPQTTQMAFGNEASMLFVTGDVKAAVKAYKRADKVGAKNEAILYNLGLAYESLGKMGHAAECYSEVLLMAPSRMDVLEKMAHIAVMRSDDEEVELLYRKILTLQPGKRGIRLKLVDFLAKTGRREEAVEFVEAHLKERPRDAEFRLLQPRLYAQMEWYEVAVMHYEELVKDSAFAGDPAVRFELAQAAYDQIVRKNGNKYDAAIYYLKEASDLLPNDPTPEMYIATLYLRYKKYREQALDYLKKAQAKATTEAHKARISALVREAKK